MRLRRHTTFEGVHFKIPRFGRQSRGYQWLHGSKIGSLPPSRVTPMAPENKKKGAEAPPLFQSFKCSETSQAERGQEREQVSRRRRTVAIEISGTIVRFRELT